MENRIVGEIFNLDIVKISEKISEKIDVIIQKRNVEELSIYNNVFELNIYKYNSQTFLIGGTIWDYNNGVCAINKIAEILVKEDILFEIEIENYNNYSIRNSKAVNK